jgi:uncharacterized protein YjbI with pentapeptide repeats
MPAAVSDLNTLEAALKAAGFVNFIAEFDLPGERTLKFSAAGSSRSVREGKGDQLDLKKAPTARDLAGAMRQVAGRYPQATLRIDKLYLHVHSSRAELKKHFARAWAEAAGQAIPTDKDLAAQRKAVKTAQSSAKDDVVALLQSGPKGVAEFNSRPLDPDRRHLDLRKADLSNIDLSGLKVTWMRLDGADLSGSKLVNATAHEPSARYVPTSFTGAKLLGCDLTGADLSDCKCTDADFSRATLRKAILSGGTKFRANFSGADLTGIDLSFCDLKGANFTGAVLTGCKLEDASFDETTKWPKGYTPPPDMKWKGKGPDPRFAPSKREKTKQPPTDFPGFLARLQKATDPAKLQKATAMLKAERFRLFAQVANDHLVGVVKSQSEADRVYSCRLAKDGVYGCCTQNLNVCGGLKGSPCKHLLVLVVGLTQAGELDPATAHAWTQASRGVRPLLDKDAMTETLLRYKGAEAGEVDWRPTETIPEDFYAV